MVKLIDIEAKDKNDTTPDPLMAMIFFFIATSIYCVVSIFLTDSHQRLIAKFCYIIFVVVGEYFINLTLTQQMCGVAQWRTTMFITLIPWIMIFGVLQVFITMFPGWTGPFSNTFGYLVAKLMGLPDLMKKILAEPDKNIPESVRALESIQRDNSLFINELYTEPRKILLGQADNDGNLIIDKATKTYIRADDQYISDNKPTANAVDAAGKPIYEREKYEKAWQKLEDGKIIKKFSNNDERASMMDKLYHFVQMKYTISEYVWNLLTGFLVTSISYNYILNTGCAKSPQEMKERYDRYEAEEEKKRKDKNAAAANQPNYVQT
jgi:hypothetical protein